MIFSKASANIKQFHEVILIAVASVRQATTRVATNMTQLTYWPWISPHTDMVVSDGVPACNGHERTCNGAFNVDEVWLT